MPKAKPSKQANPDGSMALTGHLKELRNRLVICITVLLAGFCVCLAFASKLVTMLTDMGAAYRYIYVYIAPQELLMVYFSVALTGGIVLAFPFIAYHVYAFCSPGLRRREKVFVLGTLLFGTAFFCLGVLFAYFINVPFMLRFLIRFSSGVSISASISIREYVSFLLTVFLVFGAVFELPVVSALLTLLGLLRAEWMIKGRKVMIVAIFFAAAVITPPDVVSQVMVAVPMIGLYELSILLSRLCQQREKWAARLAKTRQNNTNLK